MHETKDENVKGYIDCFDKNEDSIFLKGWAFHIVDNILLMMIMIIHDLSLMILIL
jgi:hypothetical protein